MTSINFHASYGKKLKIVVEPVNGSTSQWVEIKIYEDANEIGEVTVFDATTVEVLELAD